MSRGLLGGGEDTSGLHNVVGTSRSPRNSSRIPFTEDSNLLAIDLQLVAFNAHFTLVTSVGGVILEHVDHVVQGNEGIVDCYHVDILVQSGTEDQATNTTEAVDSNFDHFEGLMNVEAVIESVICQKNTCQKKCKQSTTYCQLTEKNLEFDGILSLIVQDVCLHEDNSSINGKIAYKTILKGRTKVENRKAVETAGCGVRFLQLCNLGKYGIFEMTALKYVSN